MERVTEHGASSFNDAGLWKKLLESAKSKGTTGTESYFAADIVVESLQTSMFPKLGLPAKFLEHHRKNLTENIILEGPDGHKWPVMLGMSLDSKPCLLHGWRDFATDCNLAANDQILFFLWENSHFLVQVFDSNHNIKRRGGGTGMVPVVSAHVARTTLPQVTEPIQSIGFKTTTPNLLSLPSTNNNSGVANNVHKENHTTQASPSGEELGNQEPGVQEHADPIADFSENSGERLESFPDSPSGMEKDLGLSMKERTRNRNGKTTGRRRVYDMLTFERPGSNLTIYDYLKEINSFVETAEVPVTKRMKATQGAEEKIPEKRARQAPTDRSKAVPPRKRRVRRTNKTSPAVAVEAAEAIEAAKAAANKESEATLPAPAPASDPVTPLPVEAPRQAFKRPQPRNPPPRPMIFSKRRPVTQQEREEALEAGQRYAMGSYNRTHIIQLGDLQVYCGILAGTVGFAAAMELPLQGLKQVTLYDVTGRQWRAVWRGEHPKDIGFDRDGWLIFVLEHCLEEGDVCVFELPDPKVCNISVTVFPVVPLTKTPTPSGWRDHYSVGEPVVPAVVPAVVQPEADIRLDLATFG